MKKVVVVVVVLVLGFPFLARLIPEGLSVERVVGAFEAEGYAVVDLQEVRPFREAAEQWNFFVQDYRVELHRYDSEGKVAANLGYLQRDEGQAVIETAMELSGVQTRTLPSVAVRRGKWIFYVEGPDRGRCRHLAQVFLGS